MRFLQPWLDIDRLSLIDQSAVLHINWRSYTELYLHWMLDFFICQNQNILISLWYRYNAQSQVYEDLKINLLWWKFCCVVETQFHHKTIWSGNWRLCKWGEFHVCILLCRCSSVWSWAGCWLWKMRIDNVPNTPPHRDTRKCLYSIFTSWEIGTM